MDAILATEGTIAITKALAEHYCCVTPVGREGGPGINKFGRHCQVNSGWCLSGRQAKLGR
jgi:hypothetical protein